VAKFLEDLGYEKPEERPEAVYLYKGKMRGFNFF
jgi:hypothetical protein